MPYSFIRSIFDPFNILLTNVYQRLKKTIAKTPILSLKYKTRKNKQKDFLKRF